ncbi:slipin family protein [Roseomonas terrae]|jgi:regulator of protease activity HflC (stomatin/prohibitin superfamily)|uniref:Slipin family protein n=1 Tax=Neoroseomonas terrae TaxID=424799 RepID=A0ABS5EDM5_9PROT|nr:slipin family protein [Neoroseomonas terrae]MBR0649070.1 slipin family protein [Neoroseomonas terrae]
MTETLTTTQILTVAFMFLIATVAVAIMNKWYLRLRETIWPWEVGLLYRNGRFVRELPPGRHWAGFAAREVRRVATTRQLAVVPAQEVLTADGFQVKLSVVVEYRIADARRMQEETGGHWTPLLHTAIQLALRAPVQARGLDALLADRGALEGAFAEPIAAAAAAIGLAVDKVALRDLILPAEVRRMVTDVERAKREGMAALERARGEHAALRSLANAARLMKGNPELHALRVLQALAAQPGKNVPTLVLGAGALLPVSATAGEAASDAEG